MAKGAGVITFEIESTYKVPTKAAPGYAYEQNLEGKPRKRTKRATPVVPEVKPIALHDTVISRDYAASTGDSKRPYAYRKLFDGSGKVVAIATETRRPMGFGETYQVRRMTVITGDGKRFDVLESLLQFAGSPVAPVVAPVKAEPPRPSPLPDRVTFVDCAPLMLTSGLPEVAGYLPALTSHNRATVLAVKEAIEAQQAAAARAAVRAEYEAETGEAAPAPKPMDMGKSYLWVRDSDGNWYKRERQVAS